jgi:hypothetical protein
MARYVHCTQTHTGTLGLQIPKGRLVVTGATSPTSACAASKVICHDTSVARPWLDHLRARHVEQDDTAISPPMAALRV